MSQIVGVHGIAQEQKGPNQLLEEWGPALKDGIEKVTGVRANLPGFDIGYYGGLFEPDASRPGAKSVTAQDVLEDTSDEEAAFLAEAAAEAVAQPPWSKRTGKGVPHIPALLRPAASLLTRRYSAKTSLLFIGELKQVWLYQSDDALAAKARALVEAALSDGTRVVLGHSLGSVVAFEVLAHRTSTNVHTLVTLGSPLAMLTVTKRLRRTVVPKSLRWVNVYDPADPVACAGGLQDRWPAVTDEQVANGKKDPHGIRPYLSKKVTGAAVHAALG